MKKRETKRNRGRAFALLLAILLWAEGTLGSVYAAPASVSENTTVPVPGETEESAEGEEPVPGETEEPAEGEEPVPGETEEPAEGEEPAPEEEEEPAEGEEPLPEETEEAIEEAAEGKEKPQEESVSENTPDAEEELLPEQIPGAEEALGEPPLATGEDGTVGALTFYNSVMLTSGSVSLQTPGTADIIARYKEYPWSLDVSNTYSVKPSVKSPYQAGHLSDKSLKNALNLVNFIRYVAGIPADVTLNEEYTQMAQAGALLNAVNKELSHSPAKPSGCSDELYKTGWKGCSDSNIAYNYGNIAQSLLNGWMYDGGTSNIASVGHRRWVLNPAMTQTGFGAVGAYANMYALGKGGSSITDYVAWPARNMPIELMNGSGTPWTLSLGTNYQMAQQGQVTVTLKDVSAGKTWTFSEKKQDGYFAVNTREYGMPNCIIFRPNSISYGKNSQFHVTVTGLKNQEGRAATISYNVDFFSLSDEPKEVERVTLSTQNLHLLLDDAEEKNQGTLYAALTPSNAADKTLKWASLNADIAAVDDNGMVTAKGVGETTVTVTAANGVQAACTVKVSKYTLAAEGIVPGDETGTYSLAFELQGGDSQGKAKKLTVMDGDAAAADSIRWNNENENVAVVDADGVVTPVGVGEAKVWANVEDGLKILSCEIKVESAEIPTMQMRESTFMMKADESRQLRVYLSPADTKWGKNGQKYIKWKSESAGTAVFQVKQDDGMTTLVSETISGNTVTVTARAAGKAKITAHIVDEAGNPIEGTDEAQGKGKTSCEVTVKQSAVLPAEADRPILLALTNTQNTLNDVALPEGWSWKYPDTSLTQFAGQRSKTFPAEYRLLADGQSSEEIQPAETLLSVYFLTLEDISVSVKHSDELNVLQDVSVLKSGWVAHCYVNYSFEDALEQFEEKNAALKNNTWYQKEKKELLEKLGESIVLTSSKPQTITVESVTNAEKKTALSAKEPGDAVLKAQLRLGAKTFRASQKLTVAEAVGTGFKVTWLDHFGKIGEGDSYRYTAKLSDFATGASGGINSKIRLEMTGVTKLTVKSSNSKVVALKASSVKPAETVQFEIPLMVKAAGTAKITVTGNDPAKTSRTLTLVVTDACPGLSEETVTVNTWQTVGTAFCLYAAKDAVGAYYSITDVTLEDEKGGQLGRKFSLTSENAADKSRRNCSITAKADTKTGTYKMKLSVRAGDNMVYHLPITVKVVSTKPQCSVKQKNKLNLFYQDTESLLTITTQEEIAYVSLTGCSYLVELSNAGDGYYVKPAFGATINGTKKGTLKIQLKGWKPLELPFTVGVENKALKISPVVSTVTLYPTSGLTSARIGIKNAETLPWEQMAIADLSVDAKGNYEAQLLPKEQAVLLKGVNLNQKDSFRATIKLRSSEWTDTVKLVCNVKVNLKEPGIALEKKTVQLNANDAYKGYDAVSTVVRWKNGGEVLTTQNVRVSVYCNPKDTKAKALIADSSVIFAVEKDNGCYKVKARLNNKTVAKGSYQFIVQAAKDGKIWKTPLTLKVVNTAPDKAVKITAKGSIDVLNREGSYMTLTPSLKAVNGTFEIPEDRFVKLTGRDAHLFRAVWSGDGKTIELRAKEKETLVIKYQYTVTPLLTMRNVNGETEEIAVAPVKFKVKQGSVKMSISPKSALVHSGSYNTVDLDMKAVLKGADAPEIEKVVLVGDTNAFAYVYDKEGKGTLIMKDEGGAVKGKSYSLKFQIYFAEQADNGKPVTVRYRVKVK